MPQFTPNQIDRARSILANPDPTLSPAQRALNERIARHIIDQAAAQRAATVVPFRRAGPQVPADGGGAAMTALWYCETMGMTGKWSPQLRSDWPETVMKAGTERERKASGPGPRIRAVQRVPDDLFGLTLRVIQSRLSPDAAPATGAAG